MNVIATRERLRKLEEMGKIKSWYEGERGNFIVSLGPGPNVKVNTPRDMQSLEDIVARRERKKK